jgi:hypothetical protein
MIDMGVSRYHSNILEHLLATPPESWNSLNRTLNEQFPPTDAKDKYPQCFSSPRHHQFFENKA